MRGSPRGWGARWPALAVAGVLLVACATPVTRDAERWRAREGGVSVADLATLEPAWQRVTSAGALLAFRTAAGARAAWVRQCRGASAPARAEAHALLVRLDGAQVEREGAVELARREAWSVVASALEGGRRVTVKSVTRVSARGCTDDFLLVAPQDFATLEPGFDRWWASFAEEAPEAPA
jgi:hypothetical protein